LDFGDVEKNDVNLLFGFDTDVLRMEPFSFITSREAGAEGTVLVNGFIVRKGIAKGIRRAQSEVRDGVSSLERVEALDL